VLIEVGDTGAGMTAEEREKIFTPYYTSKAQGTGLGLAIVQSVVSDHGGTVRVQSEAGRGTTFVIELPAGFLDRNVALDGDVVVWKEKILTAKYAKKCREGRKEKLLRRAVADESTFADCRR